MFSLWLYLIWKNSVDIFLIIYKILKLVFLEMLWTLTISFLFYFIFTNLKLVIVTSVIVSPFLKEKASHICDIFHVDLHF